jgi:hypothetical protein
MTRSALHLGGGKMRLSRATMQPAAVGRMNQAPAFFNITAPGRINNKKRGMRAERCVCVCIPDALSRFRHDKRASCFEMIARNIVRCIGGRLGPNLFAAGTHGHITRERKHSHLATRAGENNGKAQHEPRVFGRSLSTGNLTSSRHYQFAFDKKI